MADANGRRDASGGSREQRLVALRGIKGMIDRLPGGGGRRERYWQTADPATASRCQTLRVTLLECPIVPKT